MWDNTIPKNLCVLYLVFFLQSSSYYYVHISEMQLGPKVEDVKKPSNPLVFLSRLILGAIAATYYVLVPMYMWIKDLIVPKTMPI